MKTRYNSFENLPSEVAERLRKRIVEGEEKYRPKIPEGASVEERFSIISDSCKNPDYTEEELERIVDAFTIFNSAVQKGIPNDLYEMLVKALDTEIAQKAYAAGAVWYAHEGDGVAKEAVQRFANNIKAKIDRRADWNEERFHKEYFLKEITN